MIFQLAQTLVTMLFNGDIKKIQNLIDEESCIMPFSVEKLFIERVAELGTPGEGRVTLMHLLCGLPDAFVKQVFEKLGNKVGEDLFIVQQVNDGDTALHILTKRNSMDSIAHFFRCKMPLFFSNSLAIQNRKGDTVLHIAAENGNLELFKLFASDLCTKRVLNIVLTARNNEGQTPLAVAIQNHDAQLVKYTLFMSGKNSLKNCLRYRDVRGNTPLHAAVLTRDSSVVYSIIDAHYSYVGDSDASSILELKNIDGHGALHVAEKEKLFHCIDTIFGYILRNFDYCKRSTLVAILTESTGISHGSLKYVTSGGGVNIISRVMSAENDELFTISKVLISQHYLKELFLAIDDLGATPLHYMTPSLVKLKYVYTCLQSNFQKVILRKDIDGKTAIHTLCWQADSSKAIECLKFIFEQIFIEESKIEEIIEHVDVKTDKGVANYLRTLTPATEMSAPKKADLEESKIPLSEPEVPVFDEILKAIDESNVDTLKQLLTRVLATDNKHFLLGRCLVARAYNCLTYIDRLIN